MNPIYLLHSTLFRYHFLGYRRNVNEYNIVNLTRISRRETIKCFVFQDVSISCHFLFYLNEPHDTFVKRIIHSVYERRKIRRNLISNG